MILRPLDLKPFNIDKDVWRIVNWPWRYYTKKANIQNIFIAGFEKSKMFILFLSFWLLLHTLPDSWVTFFCCLIWDLFFTGQTFAELSVKFKAHGKPVVASLLASINAKKCKSLALKEVPLGLELFSDSTLGTWDRGKNFALLSNAEEWECTCTAWVYK